MYLTKPFEVDRLRRNIALAFEGMTPAFKRHTLDSIKSGKATPPLPFMQDLPETEPAHESSEAHPLPPTARPTELNDRIARIQAAAAGHGHAETSSPSTSQRNLLPKAPPPPTRPVPMRPASQAIHGMRPGSHGSDRPRVFILEADQQLVDVLRTILDQQCETFISKDPIEAEAQLPGVEPDILVVSARLPRITGYAFLDTIRRDPVQAAIPAIFITEKEVYRERLAMATKGVKHAIGKPVRPFELSQIVHEILNDPNFVLREKSQTLSELTLTAGKRKAAIDQKNLGRPSRETVNTMGAFLKDNVKKE